MQLSVGYRSGKMSWLYLLISFQDDVWLWRFSQDQQTTDTYDKSEILPCQHSIVISLLQNDKGQCPADVVPDPLDMTLEMADATTVVKELKALLRQSLPRPTSPLALTLHSQSPAPLSDKARKQLATMGIRLGDRVMIARQKVCCRPLFEGCIT